MFVNVGVGVCVCACLNPNSHTHKNNSNLIRLSVQVKCLNTFTYLFTGGKIKDSHCNTKYCAGWQGYEWTEMGKQQSTISIICFKIHKQFAFGFASAQHVMSLFAYGCICKIFVGLEWRHSGGSFILGI